MKAWLVRVKDQYCATVVFAETRGKAKSIALHTDCCEDADFCDIEIRRLPHIDKYYKEGKIELDWLDQKDRVILFDECDFRCEYVEEYLCKDCPVKEHCEDYEYYKEEYIGE